MELGVSSFLWLQEDLISQIPLIKESGIKFVEISGLWVPWLTLPTKHFDYQNIQSWLKLGKTMNEYELKAHSLHVPTGGKFDISALNEDARKFTVTEIIKSINMFSELNGAEVVIVHPSIEIENIEAKRLRLEKSKESLKEIVVYCESRGMKVAVENLPPGTIGDRVEKLLELVNSFRSYDVGICLDTGHAHINGIDSAQALKEIGNKLFALHVADNFGKEDEHLLPFEGSIDWASFMSELRKLDSCPIFMFEIAERNESLLHTLRKMKESFAKLQSFL